MKLNYQVAPSSNLFGTVQIPGDKSISHRALMLSSIAEGQSRIYNFLPSHDCLDTLNAIKQFGIRIDIDESRENIQVWGQGKYAWCQPSQAINCGNSGTMMRLLCGFLAGQAFSSILCGDISLSHRPMARIAEPLKSMGAKVELSPGSVAPIHIFPSRLRGITFQAKVASAQVKSSLLFASLYAQGKTEIQEIIPTRDHTEKLFQLMGAEIKILENGSSLYFPCDQKLHGLDIHIPSDISSAAFFIVAGLIAKDTHLSMKGIGNNPLRNGIITVLKKMGGAY